MSTQSPYCENDVFASALSVARHDRGTMEAYNVSCGFDRVDAGPAWASPAGRRHLTNAAQ